LHPLIQRELHGQMPQQLADKWQAMVSLNPEATRDAAGLIPTDEAPASAWRESLANLLEDPDPPLPSQV
jgi:hypothetical protein